MADEPARSTSARDLSSANFATVWDDVARAVTQAAVVSPANGTIEVGGPEVFRLDVLVGRALASLNDPRQVIADPHARYYGAAIESRTLVPVDASWVGQVRFDEWMRDVARPDAVPAHDVSSAGGNDEAR